MASWLQEWLTVYALPAVKQSTYISYEGYVRNHLTPILGKIKLSKLSLTEIQEFFNVKGWGKGCTQLSPKTLRNVHNMLNACLEQAVIKNLIYRNPIKGVKLPSIEPKEMRVLSIDEQKILEVAVINSQEVYAFGVIFALYTGIRLGELLGLQWQDVNFQKQTIKIRRTIGRLNKVDEDGNVVRGNAAEYGQSTEIVVRPPKTLAARREIPIISELWQDILDYKNKQQKLINTLGSLYDDQGYIFSTSVGKPCDARVYQKFFERLVESADVQKTNFHALRHTFATRSLESGMDIKVLSAILGHSQASTTLNRYAHALPDHKKASMEKIREHYNIAI